jgi:hypothetical protein
MKLIYESNGQEVKVGDVVHTRNTKTAHIVESITPPHKPSSTGRVNLISMDERKTFSSIQIPTAPTTASFFPGVIGAVWVGRTDQ